MFIVIYWKFSLFLAPNDTSLNPYGINKFLWRLGAKTLYQIKLSTFVRHKMLGTKLIFEERNDYNRSFSENKLGKLQSILILAICSPRHLFLLLEH